MSFVKKGVPPPDVEEGAILRAQIVDIKQVTSQWKDDQGNPKEQLEFDLQLENGYAFRSWMAFYISPSDKSRLGKLATNFVKTTKKQCTTVDQFITTLKEYGALFVKCTGFREYEEEMYPNFAIVVEKIPVEQKKLNEPTPTVDVSTGSVANLKVALLHIMESNRAYARTDLVQIAKTNGSTEDVQIETTINGLLEDGKIRPKFEALNLVGFTKAS